jgi:hypothetical protein
LFLLGAVKSVIELISPDFFGIFGDSFLWISMIIGIAFTVKYPAYAKNRLARRRV